MRVLVVRNVFSPKSTISEIYLDGEFFCYGLEPPVRPEKPCAIPLGSYDLTIRYSGKFGRLMPHVEEVPGFVGIEVHTGNTPEDTEGCLILGLNKGASPDLVINSHLAFQDFFQKLQESETPNYITYTGEKIV